VESLAGRQQYGPDFLRLPESKWSQDCSVADKVRVETEHCKIHIVGEQINTHSPIDFYKFSSWRLHSYSLDIECEHVCTKSRQGKENH